MIPAPDGSPKASMSSPPQPFEAPARGAGVVDGVPGVAMSEVVLDEVEVVPLVGQREAAEVPPVSSETYQAILLSSYRRKPVLHEQRVDRLHQQIVRRLVLLHCQALKLPPCLGRQP